MKAFAILLCAVSLAAQPWPQATPRAPRQLVGGLAAEYTPEAREARLQGTVMLMLEVTPEGSVAGAKVKRGLGLGLDERALAAAKQWIFAPGATTEIRPVEVPFVMDPRWAWQVAGAHFLVDLKDIRAQEIVKPALSTYIPPDALVCSGLHSFLTVNLNVGADGAPGGIEVVPATPEDARATTAVDEAVARWRFEPAKADGKPRPAKATILMECSGTAPAEQSGPVSRAGNGVAPPALIFKVEPDYSEAARKAKFQGSVVLSLVVEANGKPSDIRVVKSLGMGLDEEAIAAVMQWRFEPGMKDGQPVRVMASINVNFRLL